MKAEPQSICPLPMNDAAPSVQIRVHGTDGSIQTFTQHGDNLVRHTLDGFEPARMFTQQRITIANGCSLTTFITSRVTRIDLVTEDLSNWNLPPGLVEAVELTEPAFRALTQDRPPRERQEASRSPDRSVMTLLDIAVVAESCPHSAG